MLFDDWFGLLRILVMGVAAYAALVVVLRVSGKRTLSKMNAFDLVITISLGSALATVILNSSVPLAEGVLALALLVFLQYAITWLSVRSSRVQRLVKSEPTLLVRDGRYLDRALARQRVTRAEVEAALRQSGVAAVSEAAMVVLETDGSLSVVTREAGGRRSAAPPADL
ncbi:DUF421 domain-containing protein [Aquibium sp. A9E412]|uniref:DUF421 domain-containing protein n=1 Tax=Aquibium sp. A9E412 TaxID=2976767 RepID=UPI0025AECFB8|nr:YetF domain-containing protein [Aquibium sp. A9E412]MDN2568125.1 DUF421 domain-containing protein [Aquibium sp. A9E412]